MPINLGRLAQLYRYFPINTATAMTICEGARLLLDPHCKYSYAQTGEDRILASYLDVAKPGYYVDVGCHHPFSGSNTLSLYSRGWRGLVVDGNPDLIRTFKRCRPRDTAICAVVSDREDSLTFTIAERPELSTVCQQFEHDWIKSSGIKARRQVQAVRLQRLMEENDVPKRFELLTVDVEGHDYEVLTSFDINEFRPRLIVVEMHGFRPGCKNSNPVFDHLENSGYQLVSYSVMNGIFLDSRQTH